VFPHTPPPGLASLQSLKSPNPSDQRPPRPLCQNPPPSFPTCKSDIRPCCAYFYIQRTQEEHRELQRLAATIRRLKEENRRLRSAGREFEGEEDLELQIALQNSGES